MMDWLKVVDSMQFKNSLLFILRFDHEVCNALYSVGQSPNSRSCWWYNSPTWGGRGVGKLLHLSECARRSMTVTAPGRGSLKWNFGLMPLPQ